MHIKVFTRDQPGYVRVDYFAFHKASIGKLRDSTSQDLILAIIYQFTQQDCLYQRRHRPQIAKRYWDFRDELSMDNSLFLKGPYLVIPILMGKKVTAVDMNTVRTI